MRGFKLETGPAGRELAMDDRLRTSLDMIQQATEEIWATDAPRIIQNYTDHGVTHSERVSGFINKLLSADNGKSLSSREMYLLLAGSYLHDIGMQCDVVKFPAIKHIAEELGAQFNTEFTAQMASEYSIGEQNAIRENHHYLSAAWIDHAKRTGETALGLAAKTIPDVLVKDLMDVVKYHTKLTIDTCPSVFDLYQTERKQLIAALLRFSDELDIDARRVSIETVKNFATDPHSAVYWWIHNYTTIEFISQNLVTLTIRLHPNNVRCFGSFIYNTFIDGFMKKNSSVQNILLRNNILIYLSHDSRVVEHDYTEEFPDEIAQMVETMIREGLVQSIMKDLGYIIKLNINIDDISSELKENIIILLQRLSGDNSLRLHDIKQGSSILILKGTIDGFKEIERLFKAGKLSDVFGIKVQELRLVILPLQIEEKSMYAWNDQKHALCWGILYHMLGLNEESEENLRKIGKDITVFYELSQSILEYEKLQAKYQDSQDIKQIDSRAPILMKIVENIGEILDPKDDLMPKLSREPDRVHERGISDDGTETGYSRDPFKMIKQEYIDEVI